MKKFFSMVLAFLIIILSSFVIAGCNKVSTEDDVDNGKIKIVSTIFPYYDFARNIAGDKADVKIVIFLFITEARVTNGSKGFLNRFRTVI